MDLVRLINHPELMSKETLYELRNIVALYPYYQTARILMLKNMYLLHDSAFDDELRRTALYVTDRSMLFQLVESAHYEFKNPSEEATNKIETSNDDRTISIIDNFLDSAPEQELEPQNEPKRSSKSWIIALACVIVVVVGIFGFQYLKSEDKKEATATTENKTSAKTTEKKATENNAGEDVADAKDSTEKSQVLSYTDNEDMDLSACTDSDDYQYVSSEDNSFEFAYPKYLFNRSYVNKTGNQYTLEYANSDKADDYEIKAVISSQKAGSGNAVKSVQKLYKQKKKSIKNVTYAYPQGGKTPKLYQGKSSMIVMGYLDSDKTKCEYVLLTSDGKKDYMMQINFFDSDYKDEYKEINYVVDCMYRGCSFTNSTYQMRTFDQFREDDMGVKK